MSGFVWPIAALTNANYKSWISSPFGYSPGYDGHHNGTDFAFGAGTAILSIYRGTVHDKGYNGTLGHWIQIRHDAASYSYYFHMRVASPLRVGASVETGERIGEVGSTGLSTGNHLHLAISGSPNFAGYVDPVPYILSRQAEPTPPPLRPHERRVLPDYYANRRIGSPSTAAPLGEPIAAGDTGEMKGYVHGQVVDGNDIWFVGLYSGDYFHSGGFVGGADTTGLADLTPTPVDPEPTDPPIEWPEYDFEAFSPVVTDVIPAHPSNFWLGRFPANPSGIVMHDFGTKGVNTFSSVINYFTADHTLDESSQVSAHFVVGWDGNSVRTVQMVSLEDRAFHAGPNGNDFIGIEIDPLVSNDDEIAEMIKESVVKLLEALRDHYKADLTQVKHPDIPGAATACGDDLDLDDYAIAPYGWEPGDDDDDQDEEGKVPGNGLVGGIIGGLVIIIGAIVSAILGAFG